jgi:16S rRNA (adenine1518-N6/adenine1519-N6)-dimethyltransferase
MTQRSKADTIVINRPVKLSEIKQILAAEGTRLTKSLGQNFLHDGNQLRRIIQAADLRPTDCVLEIGPGLGALTGPVLAKAGRVLAIEKDRRLFELLRHRLPPAANISLVHDDAFDYLARAAENLSGWKVVANLPYSIGSRLLVELVQRSDRPKQITATLQFEVVQRIVANAGDQDYGVLALLTQLRYQSAGHFRIPASCFFPEPEVDSACVTLIRCKQPPLSEAEGGVFAQIVKRSFSQRRKMMLKLLRADWPEAALEEAFEKARLGPKARAETVTLEQFVALARMLYPLVAPVHAL